MGTFLHVISSKQMDLFLKQLLLLSGLHIQRGAIFPVALLSSCAPSYSQYVEQDSVHSSGRREAELSADLGKYVPDNRGKYTHIHIPYDGGYGDRGLKYENDKRGGAFLPREELPLKLGPEDHLRFMIDFNFNGSGWQVIQFEWIRDDVGGHQFNYVNENKLWDQLGEEERATPEPGNDTLATRVHVDGEYIPGSHNESTEGGQQTNSDAKIQSVIADILEYIRKNIIVNLH